MRTYNLKQVVVVVDDLKLVVLTLAPVLLFLDLPARGHDLLVLVVAQEGRDLIDGSIEVLDRLVQLLRVGVEAVDDDRPSVLLSVEDDEAAQVVRHLG